MPHQAIRFTAFLAMVFLVQATSRGQDPRAVELGQAITFGEQLSSQGKHREAVAQFARARQLATQMFGANHINVAALAQTEGLLLKQLGEYDRAETLIAQGLKIAQAVGDQDFEAEALNNLATTKWEQAHYAESQALHEQAFVKLSQRYGSNHPNVAVSRNNLAGVYKSLGRYVEADRLYQDSIKVLRNHQPQYAIELADALMNLADLYSSQGHLPRSESMLLEGIEIKQRSLGPNHYEVARTRNNLAALYSTMGRYQESENLQKQVLKSLEAGLGPEHVDVARTALNLAGLYQRQKRYDEAEAHYQRALAIRSKVLGPEHPDIALTLHNMASLYSDRGDYASAGQIYDRALAIRKKVLGADHPTVAYTLMAIGHLRYRENRLEEAEEAYREALAIRQVKLSENHPDLAYTYSALGDVEAATERWDASAKDFDRARRGFRQYIDQVLPGLSEADQLTFLEEVDHLHYHTALSLVLAQPQHQAIVDLSANWVLNGKAVSQQALAQRELLARDTTNPTLSEIVESLLIIRKKLASLTMISDSKEADATRQQRIAELSAEETKKSQRLADEGGRGQGASQWVETEQVRSVLKKDAVLIEIARFKHHDYQKRSADIDQLPERYVAWIIPAAGAGAIQLVDLGDAATIDESIKEARDALEGAPTTIREVGEPEAEAALMPVLKRLAEKILYPLLPSMAEKEAIYLAPDSLMWVVPWNALPLEDGSYAIEKHDIRLTVSGRYLVRNDAKLPLSSPIIFADPDFNLDPVAAQNATQQLFREEASDVGALRSATPAGQFKLGIAGRLPGTKAEAAAVLPQLEAFAGSKATVYSGQWALEAVFKRLKQPSVLLLSTHGFFQDDAAAEESSATSPASSVAQAATNPLLRCGLLLAGCNKPLDTSRFDGEDGILTGAEIVTADLRGTELVVLSACETGLGEVHDGEGVAGLRQAFQLAGARSVVSTLWQIPDRETARLISDFFAGLAQSGDKPHSLRRAQLELIETRRHRNAAAHPFFWAAFTMTGE